MPKQSGRKPSKKRRQRETKFQDDKIYFEGKVVETYPATVFGVEVQRKNGLEPMLVRAGLKTILKLRKVMVIKGDTVRLEMNPEDMASEDGALKGTIIGRAIVPPRLPQV